MTELWPLFASAFTMGLLGSAHCLAMCSGMSGLFSAGAQAVSFKTQFPLALSYNAGRVASYAILGGLVAAIGASVVSAIPSLVAPVRIASAVIIIIVGLQVMFNWRLLAPVENMGASIWKHIAPGAKSLIPADNIAKAVGLGLIWGWLPCGLVYGALLLAASTADSIGGAIAMAAFGLGTMPAMISTGLSAAKLSSFMARNKAGAGALIILLGIATLAMPFLAVL